MRATGDGRRILSLCSELQKKMSWRTASAFRGSPPGLALVMERSSASSTTPMESVASARRMCDAALPCTCDMSVRTSVLARERNLRNASTASLCARPPSAVLVYSALSASISAVSSELTVLCTLSAPYAGSDSAGDGAPASSALSSAARACCSPLSRLMKASRSASSPPESPRRRERCSCPAMAPSLVRHLSSSKRCSTSTTPRVTSSQHTRSRAWWRARLREA
mmetsp:Transcript_17696/g.35973  ORF Transcript_17696/g.35973 Transcript_17696/m.35973 type:complete len:224 (-) Transcript_17696:60-731(-)